VFCLDRYSATGKTDGSALSIFPVLEIERLTKIFRPAKGIARWLSASPISVELKALDEVTFQVYRGEVFGLLGPNGAGKTTLLKILASLIQPCRGKARVCGMDVVREEDRIRGKVGLVVSDERSFYWRLSGRENLRFYGSLWNLSGRRLEEKIRSFAELLDMQSFLDQRYDSYSTGMRQRLAVARGLLGSPEVLLLDEPTRGLDPVSSGNLLRCLRGIADQGGVTILMVTHRLSEAKEVCDRVGILNQGKLERIGRIEELSADPISAQRYTFCLHTVGQRVLDTIAAFPWISDFRVQGSRMDLVIEESELHLTEILDLLREEQVQIARIESGTMELGEVLFQPNRKEAV